MKKITKEDVRNVISSLLAFAVTFFLKTCISDLCIKTNSPLMILIDVIFSGYAVTMIFFIFVLFLLSIGPKFVKELKEMTSEPFFKKIVIAFLLMLIIPSFFPLSHNYGFLKINGKKPLKIQYSYCLLADAINGSTESLSLEPEEFKLERNTYRTRGGRGSRSRSYTVHYADFKDNSVYLYRNFIRNYIDLCQKHDIDINIEYLKNSCIIKTINGMDIYDEYKFNNAVSEIEQEEIQKQLAENAVKEKEKQEELALFKAFFYSEGKYYDDIIEGLDNEGIENTYDVVYISTQYYETGKVAFFDNMERVVYVVRDNDGEDMTEVPSLPYNGTFAEITEILDEHKIKWEFDCFGNFSAKKGEETDHSKDTLKTIHCSPGTPIPKDYVFWFSVDHVELSSCDTEVN